MITSFRVLSLNMKTALFSRGSLSVPLFCCFRFSCVLSSPLDCFGSTLGLLHCRLLIVYLRHTGLMIHGAAFLFFPINLKSSYVPHMAAFILSLYQLKSVNFFSKFILIIYYSDGMQEQNKRQT